MAAVKRKNQRRRQRSVAKINRVRRLGHRAGERNHASAPAQDPVVDATPDQDGVLGAASAEVPQHSQLL